MRSFVDYTPRPLVATVGIFTPASTKVCSCVILPRDELHDFLVGSIRLPLGPRHCIGKGVIPSQSETVEASITSIFGRNSHHRTAKLRSSPGWLSLSIYKIVVVPSADHAVSLLHLRSRRARIDAPGFEIASCNRSQAEHRPFSHFYAWRHTRTGTDP